MKRFYLILLFFATGFFLLTDSVQADCCNAGFSSNALSTSTIRFVMDDSAAADIQFVQWAFGDGSYSNEKTPVHAYLYTGTYAVTLTVFKQAVNGVQKSCSETRDLWVSFNDCSAAFVFSIQDSTTSFYPLHATQYDSTHQWSTGTFFWTFGDGQTSADVNPVHTYNQAGYYTACLYTYRSDSTTADSCYQCQSLYIQKTRDSLPSTCNADFSYSTSGNTVTLYPSQTGSQSYWTDAYHGGTYFMSNQQVSFPDTGTYRICRVQISDSALYDTCRVCKDITMNVQHDYDSVPLCNAGFVYSLNGYTVTVQVDSFRYFVTNSWNFNNEYHSSDTAFASFTFSTPGAKTICHKSYPKNAYGQVVDTCTVCKDIYIAPVMDSVFCHSSFIYEVNGNTIQVFADSSSGIDFWNFNGEAFGGDSINRYTFLSAGVKNICHTSIGQNSNGSAVDSCKTCQQITIEPIPVSVSPNPAVHVIHVKSSGGALSSIHLYNLSGVMVKSFDNLSGKNHPVDVSDLAKGSYYVWVILADGRSYKSLVIVQ